MPLLTTLMVFHIQTKKRRASMVLPRASQHRVVGTCKVLCDDDSNNDIEQHLNYFEKKAQK